MVEAIATWRRLARVCPAERVEARRELQRAARCAAAPAARRSRDADAGSLAWSRALEGFVGQPLGRPGTASVRVALRVPRWSLALVDESLALVAERGLTGRSTDGLLAWLETSLASAGVPAASGVPTPPSFPRTSDPFGPPLEEELAELVRWYADADELLAARLGSWPEATPVRCSPPHLGLTTTLELAPGSGGARSIRVGMSPGEDALPEPSWFVMPSPAPRGGALPTLAGGGRWALEEGLGARLRASELAATATAQSEQVATFLDSALAAARSLLA